MALIPQLYTADVPLSSLITPDKIPPRSVVGIVNRNLQGIPKFMKAAKNQQTHITPGLSVHYATKEYDSVIYVYAKNNEGWRQLIQLTNKPSLDVLQNTSDCFVLLPIRKSSDVDFFDKHYKEFPNMRAGATPNRLSVQLCESLDVPIHVVYETFYSLPEDRFALDILTAIKEKTTVHTFNESILPAHIPTALDWNQWYSNHRDWLQNTNDLLLSCEVDLTVHPMYMPLYRKQPAYDYLLTKCQEGLQLRGVTSEQYQERLNHELSVIDSMGYSDYFMITHEFMKDSRNADIQIGPGRGSSAGSLVAFSLFITDVDPLKYGLLFERFLNPERVSLPDIDIDFEDGRRKEAVQFMVDVYGSSHTAQIGTIDTLAMKAVARNVGRVFGFTEEELSFISNELNGESIEDSWRIGSPAFKDFVMQSEHHKLWLRTASKLEGLPRGNSTHAAGVVLSSHAFDDILPIVQGEELPITQWDMDDVQESGFLKLDFLGLRTLTLLKNIGNLVGVPIDFTTLDLTDESTLDLFRTGNTYGIFQFESDGMKNALQQIRPSSFEDVAVTSALYRPGPMQYIPEFASRKNQHKTYRVAHPLMESIVRDTQGIMVYQEQIMQVASAVAGYSFAEADLLRRAMSKKKTTVIEGLRKDFIERSVRNELSAEAAGQVFADIEKFADYGFPKAHAIAYAMISFYLAYFKTHHPKSFYAAHIQLNKGKLPEVMNQMKKEGLAFEPPNIQQTNVSTNEVSLGFDTIKGISKSVAELLAEGEYRTFLDVVYQLGSKYFKPAVLEPLIYSGALREFGTTETLIRSIPEITRFLMMFPTPDSLEGFSPPHLKELPELPMPALLEKEYEVFGFYLSGHPASYLKETIQFEGLDLSAVASLHQNQYIQIAGFLSSLRKIKTKKGDAMAFLDFEDESGTLSTVLFSEVLEKVRNIAIEGTFLLAEGRTQLRNNSIQLVLTNLEKAGDKYDNIQ